METSAKLTKNSLPRKEVLKYALAVWHRWWPRMKLNSEKVNKKPYFATKSEKKFLTLDPDHSQSLIMAHTSQIVLIHPHLLLIFVLTDKKQTDIIFLVGCKIISWKQPYFILLCFKEWISFLQFLLLRFLFWFRFRRLNLGCSCGNCFQVWNWLGFRRRWSWLWRRRSHFWWRSFRFWFLWHATSPGNRNCQKERIIFVIKVSMDNLQQTLVMVNSHNKVFSLTCLVNSKNIVSLYCSFM